MKSPETSFEHVKYVFNENEKKEIAQSMAQKVGELQTAEDELKAVKSDFKSRMDALQAQVNGAATKLNNGYEWRSMECRVEYSVNDKIVAFYRLDNQEFVKERAMRPEELQLRIDEGV